MALTDISSINTTDFSNTETNMAVRNIGSSVSNSNTDNVEVSASVYMDYISSLVASAGDVVSDMSNSVVQIYLAGNNIYSAFSNVSQYEELFNTVLNTGSSYINEKIERLKSLVYTNVPVTVGTIIGEIAPYAIDPSKIATNLESNIVKLLGFVTGTYVEGDSGQATLKSLLKAVGIDALDAFNDDTTLKNVFNNLNAVKAFANVLNVIVDAKDIIKKIKTMLETAQPLVSMSTNLAEVFATGGVSAFEMANTASIEGQKLTSNIEVLALYAIKKFIFPLKIQLPAILVGAVDSISVRSAMLDLPDNLSWLSALFNDDFFNNVGYTMMWADSISTAINSVQGAISSIKNMTTDWSNYTYTDSNGNVIVTSTGKAVSRGDYMKSVFMQSMTSSYMTSAVEQARKTAYLPDYSKITWITKESSSKKLNLTEEETSDEESLTSSIYSIVYSSSTSDSTTDVAVEGEDSEGLTELDKILNDNSEENPITSIDAIITVSKTVYDNIM